MCIYWFGSNACNASRDIPKHCAWWNACRNDCSTFVYYSTTALLMLLKERINKWTIIRVKPGATTKWRNFASFVMKRPVTLILVALIMLGYRDNSCKEYGISHSTVDSLPKTYDSDKHMK